MIARLSGRRRFERLRSEGRRRGRGRIRLTVRPATTDDEPIAYVAFAVPRSVAKAVDRNRARRRVRAILAEIDRPGGSGLAPGDYLFRLNGDLRDWDAEQLRHEVGRLVSDVPAPVAVS